MLKQSIYNNSNRNYNNQDDDQQTVNNNNNNVDDDDGNKIQTKVMNENYKNSNYNNVVNNDNNQIADVFNHDIHSSSTLKDNSKRHNHHHHHQDELLVGLLSGDLVVDSNTNQSDNNKNRLASSSTSMNIILENPDENKSSSRSLSTTSTIMIDQISLKNKKLKSKKKKEKMKNKNPFEYQTMSDEDDDDDEEEESCDGNSSDRNVNIENNQTTTTTQQQQLSINNHCHDLQMDNNQRKFARQAMIKLIITLIISMMFMIIEIVGGYLSHSLAIFTDAAHLFSDLISFAISLIAIYLAQKSPTRSKSFGYLRLEVIGVLFSVFLIWFLTGLLIYFAINRIISNEFEIDSITMMTVSSIGLAFNLVMWLTLSSKCCCHSINDEKEDQETNGHHHSHNHNQHNHQQHGHSHINMNVRAAILHIIGDCIQSIGVIIASIIIHFRPDWKLADPICTLLFAGLVFTTTYSIMKDSLHILMEGFPNEYQYEQVKQMLLEQIPGVKNVHSLHIWSLTHGRNVLAVHLTVDYPDDDNTDDHNDRNQFELIREKAELLIRSKLQISLTTIQIEYHRPDMIQNCSHCIGPKT